MAFLIIFFAVLDASIANTESTKKKNDPPMERLSVYQEQIKKCIPQLKSYSEFKTMSQIYDRLNGKFLLISESTLYRELFYRSLSSQGQQGKSEDRKIKVTDNKIELFRVESDERLSPINTGMRQQKGIIDGQIKQLTLNAKIEKDWSKVREIREGGLVIEVVRVDGKITQFQFNTEKTKLKLDCLMVNNSEVCLCTQL